MGSLLNKHECEPDDDGTESKSRKVTWRNVSKNSSRTTTHADDSSRPKKRASKYTISKYSSRCAVAKRPKRPALRRSRQGRDGKRSRRCYRSRSCSRRRRTRFTVRKRRNRKRSELTYCRRRLHNPTRSHGRKRKRGRPRKDTQSLVYEESGNSLARKREEEARRYRRDLARKKRNIAMREVNPRRDVECMFKSPDKSIRSNLDNDVDDIQENPLSFRKRCNSVVNSIPDLPFDGRKRNKNRRTRGRNKQAKMRAYTRRYSNYKRKFRKKAGVSMWHRRPAANRDRNRNASGSMPRWSKQEVMYMQSGPGDICRPNETTHQCTSDDRASCPKMFLGFVRPYSRRGVETTRSLRSCSCYCCRLRNCVTRKGQVGHKSADSCCNHCHRLNKHTTKRCRSVSSRRRRKSRSRSEISNLQTDINKDEI